KRAFRQMNSSWAVSACTQLVRQDKISFAHIVTSSDTMLPTAPPNIGQASPRD
ncbi:hypothetical protein COCVIDRAFT_88114, partial [Bipolaris victoriae FI3]